MHLASHLQDQGRLPGNVLVSPMKRRVKFYEEFQPSPSKKLLLLVAIVLPLVAASPFPSHTSLFETDRDD